MYQTGTPVEISTVTVLTGALPHFIQGSPSYAKSQRDAMALSAMRHLASELTWSDRLVRKAVLEADFHLLNSKPKTFIKGVS